MPGHVTTHNTLRAGILEQAARFGVPVDLEGPYKIGDPAHIGQHTATVAALKHIAAVAGIAVTLPGEKAIGDTGHIDDHALLDAALLAISKATAWNEATGGTISEYVDAGKKYRVHTFEASDTLNVVRSVPTRPFDVLVVAGGAWGGTQDDGNDRCGGGGAGGVIEKYGLSIAAGAHPVTVGKTGNGGYPNLPTNGENSSVLDLIAYGGGHGGCAPNHGGANAGAGGSGGGGAYNVPYRGGGGAGIDGQGYRGGDANGWPSDRCAGGGGAAGPGNGDSGGPPYISKILGTDLAVGSGGNGPGSKYGGGGAGGVGWQGAGQPGVVIVRYQIGAV